MDQDYLKGSECEVPQFQVRCSSCRLLESDQCPIRQCSIPIGKKCPKLRCLAPRISIGNSELNIDQMFARCSFGWLDHTNFSLTA